MSYPNNHPTGVTIHDEMIWITLRDKRVFGAPLHWFPWLAGATPQQQMNFELHAFSIFWPDLDDGLDIEALVTGNWTTPMDEADKTGEPQ